MSQDGVIVAVEEKTALVSCEELERYRLDVRKMELQVKRKEAELRRVEEEKVLLNELSQFNEMFIKKLETRVQAGNANEQLKIAPESLQELMELEDAQKMENMYYKQLQNDAEILAKKRESIEQSVTDQNCLINKIKEDTGVTNDITFDVNLLSVDNEYIDKKRVLAALRDEQAMVKQHTERLTSEIETLTNQIDENKDIEQKISDADNALRVLKGKHIELQNKITSCERINKNKERMLSKNNSVDPYKKVRQLDSDKRVVISDITSLRKTKDDNSSAIKSLQQNLCAITSNLNSINQFLHMFFENVKENGEMESVASDVQDVSLRQFEDLYNEVNALRDVSKYRDAELENHDAMLERLEGKLLVLKNAIHSLDKSTKLQINKKEKEFQVHNSFADEICREYELQRQNLLKELKVLRHQLSL